MSTLEDRNKENVGWYYLDSLQSINEKGRWPGVLSERERKLLKKIGFVDLKYTTHFRGGRQPTLTELAKRIMLAVSPTGHQQE